MSEKISIALLEKRLTDLKKIDGGGEPPYDDSMLKRIEKLEASLTTLLSDIAVIRSNYVSKEDLHKEISAQTWRLITFVSTLFVTVSTALVAATYFITTHAK